MDNSSKCFGLVLYCRGLQLGWDKLPLRLPLHVKCRGSIIKKRGWVGAQPRKGVNLLKQQDSLCATGDKGKTPPPRWPDVLQVMSPSCLAVFQALAQISKPGEEVEISLRELAEIANFSHEQTRRALRRLQGAGVLLWINRGRGRGRKSRFKILWRFYGRKVTPRDSVTARRSERSFSRDIGAPKALSDAASPLSHTLSPLSFPRENGWSALQSKDAPGGASLPDAEKIFRRLAAALRRTALLPPGHNELRWLYTRLEGTAREALLVALWRMRRRFRNPSHLFIVAELVVQRIRQNPWCWKWWSLRGVRAVYALVTRWVKQAFWLSERVCLASQDLPAEADPASLWGLPSWMPGLGDSAWGLAHRALGVAPSPGGEGRWM